MQPFSGCLCVSSCAKRISELFWIDSLLAWASLSASLESTNAIKPAKMEIVY